MNKKTPASLRSARWFAPDDLCSFGHRSRAMQLGYGPEDWADKPVIAIINTWSDVRACHGQCMTIGTASTMIGIAETCGFTPPVAFSIPAVASTHVISS